MPLGIPSQRTWATNDIVTAAMMNANVRDAVNFLLNVPVFYGQQSTTQSIANNTYTALSLDTNIYDTYSGHSTVTNNSRYTAQQPGLYMIIGRSGFTTNATGARGALIIYNGGGVSSTTPNVTTGNAGASAFSYTEVVAFQLMAIGDYVEVFGYQASGGALSTTTGGSSMQVLWMHA